MNWSDLSTGEQTGLAGAVVTVLGTFLPWATVGALSVSGVDGDGVIALVLAAAAAGVILVRDWETTDQLAVAAIGVVCLLVGLGAWGNVSSMGNGFINVTPGIGLFVTMFGSAMLIAGGVVGYRNEDEADESVGEARGPESVREADD